MRVPFGTQAYQHTSLPLSAQRMVNCYLEQAPPHAKTLAAVIASFGVKTRTTIGTGPYRGAAVIRGVLYVVSGTALYRVSSTYVGTALGTIPGTGPCYIVGDEINVAVGTIPDLYVWNGAAVSQVTDTDFEGASWLGYIDGYYVAANPLTGRYQISDSRDPTAWNALDFASAEAAPDDIVTGIVDHKEAILFGTETSEAFYNSGNSDFPLTPISSGFIELGCPYRFGPGKIDSTVCFPAHDGKVYRLNGFSPQVISTPVVEQAIERATDREFIGMAWKEPGHAFYSLSCADFAFVYDFASQLWHERESHGLYPWRRAFTARAYDKWIVGDTDSAALGTLDGDTFTEFGAVMRASCASPPVGEDNRRIVHPRLELVFEQGVGIPTGQGSDPQVMLRFSDDGGRTWSSEKWRGLGRIGEYKRRAVWHRLGQARDRIYEYAITDPVRRTLILATTEAVAGGY